MTRLPPAQEQAFQNWAKANQVPLTSDYDMRGFFASGMKGGGINPVDGRWHWPDTWKTPLHKSFSNESIYFNPKMKDSGPKWTKTDKGWVLKDASGKVYFREEK